MTFRLVKGYVLVAISGLVILVSAVLIGLQWGNSSAFSWFGQNRTVNTALLMVCSLADAFVLLWMFKVLSQGMRAVRQGRTSRRDRPVEQADRDRPKASGEQTHDPPGASADKS